MVDAKAARINNGTPLTPTQSNMPDSIHPDLNVSWPSHTNPLELEPSSKAIESKHLTASLATANRASTVSLQTDKSRVGSGESSRIILADLGPAGSAADDGNIAIKESSSVQKRPFSSTMDDYHRDSEDTTACGHCGKPIVPNPTEELEALEAFVKILQDKRDSKRRKTAEEQNKTETMAVSYGIPFLQTCIIDKLNSFSSKARRCIVTKKICGI